MQKSVEATCRLLPRQGLAHTGFDWCPDVDVHHQFPDPLGVFCFVFVFNLYLLVIVLFLFSTVVDIRLFFIEDSTVIASLPFSWDCLFCPYRFRLFHIMLSVIKYVSLFHLNIKNQVQLNICWLLFFLFFLNLPLFF